jgi:hypothetical protein
MLLIMVNQCEPSIVENATASDNDLVPTYHYLIGSASIIS